MKRRDFLALLGAAPALGALTGRAAGLQERRYPLTRPPEVRAGGGPALTLTARPTTADLGPGRSGVWALNGSVPAPTIRIDRGARADIELENRLPEPTILHWHGLDVPEAADGHPRLAVPPGERYRYRFTVRDRAGLYWYHPHTHERTAPQTYLGLAGLLIVEDEEERALGLPSGAFETPLVLQDKRLGEGTEISYTAAAMGPDRMIGYLGDTPFANGTARASATVPRGLHRLRVLNASNARIFDLGMSDRRPFTLIGSDGGLLDRPARVERVMLGTGERADLLVDLSDLRPGERILLRSFPFEIPGMMMGRMGGGGMGGMGRGRGGGRGGMMGGMGRVPPQGAPMDLLELVASDASVEPARPVPPTLSTLPWPAVDGSAPVRTFRFESMMMRHTINGRSFDMERVDLRIPRGRGEVWTIENQSGLPHPVHIHVGQFHLLGRRGGRGRILPWENGLKDTVLVLPGETVDLAVRFDEHPGLFLMHCHNLEHEDMGMMLNFEVE